MRHIWHLYVVTNHPEWQRYKQRIWLSKQFEKQLSHAYTIDDYILISSVMTTANCPVCIWLSFLTNCEFANCEDIYKRKKVFHLVKLQQKQHIRKYVYSNQCVSCIYILSSLNNSTKMKKNIKDYPFQERITASRMNGFWMSIDALKCIIEIGKV